MLCVIMASQKNGLYGKSLKKNSTGFKISKLIKYSNQNIHVNNQTWRKFSSWHNKGYNKMVTWWNL